MLLVVADGVGLEQASVTQPAALSGRTSPPLSVIAGGNTSAQYCWCIPAPGSPHRQLLPRTLSLVRTLTASGQSRAGDTHVVKYKTVPRGTSQPERARYLICERD